MKIKKQFSFFNPLYQYKILVSRRELTDLQNAMIIYRERYPSTIYQEMIDKLNEVLNK